MNKKLLFGFMSLAALAACTNDDFDTKKVAQVASPVQFEIINDAETRAWMDGNSIQFSATDGDVFTLYHGATNLGDTKGYQNATYTAQNGSPATLTTPSMILEGGAVMVWPADTTFRITSAKDLTITIPAVQTNIENNIPYMSDQIEIGAFVEGAYDKSYAPGTTPDYYNTAGKDRKYPITMRPMASQLIVKADYDGTTDVIEELYGEDAAGGIDPIEVTSIDLQASTEKFTTEIPVKFTDPSSITGLQDQWDAVENNAWAKVTDFDVTNIATGGAQATQLTAKEDCLEGNDGCKFLLLPQKKITDADATSAVVVNTIYGKVVVGNASSYTTEEAKETWWKDAAAKSNIADGMKATINALSAFTSTKAPVAGEPAGAAATRYVKVLLNYLDMDGLHVKTDKQLRDVVRVWKHLDKNSAAVYLDGDANANGEFVMSQKTVDVINEMNAKDPSKQFTVMPCTETGEACTAIRLVQTAATGVTVADAQKLEKHDLLFVKKNSSTKVGNLILDKEATDWEWTNSWLISDAIEKITNEGTLKNAADATIAAYKEYANPLTDAQRNTDIYLVNEGNWNVSAGSLAAQISVVNNGVLTIAENAEFLEDSYNQDSNLKVFINNSQTLPERFIKHLEAPANVEKVGKVINNGVFATRGKGNINNYGLIRHGMKDDDTVLTKDAMTLITNNQTATTVDTWYFTSPAAAAAFGTTYEAGKNMMGTIELPYDNRNEDNISITAAANQGFVMVTTTGNEDINMANAGTYVNYLNVKGAPTNVKSDVGSITYVEFNTTGDKKVEFAAAKAGVTYDLMKGGMIVLSNVNIKLGTTVKSGVTYLSGKMYVAGKFNKSETNWNGYFGNTTSKVPTNYINFGE